MPKPAYDDDSALFADLDPVRALVVRESKLGRFETSTVVWRKVFALLEPSLRIFDFPSQGPFHPFSLEIALSNQDTSPIVGGTDI